MPTMVKSRSGAYVWDGHTVRLSCGMPTLLPWTWVEHLGGGWERDEK
jgi:hypothetical protein